MHTNAESGRLPGIPARYRHRLRRRPGWPAAPAAAAAAGLVLLAAGLVARPAAAATTLYVNASAACPGSGTQAAPYCTIKSAADTAQQGDTVRVAAGTYSETVKPVRSGQAGSPIVYQGDPGATVRGGSTNGFQLASVSWITVRGFTVSDTVREGILLSGAHHVTVTGNRVTSAGTPASGEIAQGIKLVNTNDATVSANTTDHNSEAGIQLTGTSTRNLVSANLSYQNARGYVRAAPGIDVRAPSNRVIANRAHHNEDTGIQAYTGGSGTLIANNRSWANGDHGIDNLNVPGQRIIGNTVYANVTSGINVEGSNPASTGATIANNVSVDNAINSPRTKGNIRVDSSSTPGATVNYNLVSLSSSAVMYTWGSTGYSSLKAFQDASGQEARGIQASPGFVNAGAGDFHLGAGSPAVDSANSGVSGQQAVDAEGRPRVDDPGVPNSGAGPRGYDDRGALERQGGSPPLANQPPVAALGVTPSSGAAPLTVTANASGSTDPDGTVASYSFSFGTVPVGPQSSPTASHTFTSAGTFQVKVTVTDDKGATDVATADVVVTGDGGVGGGGGGGNLVANPGFETDLTGWSATGTTRVAGGHSGGWAAQVANSSGSCTLNDSPNWVGSATAGTYTGSIWVRATTAGATVKLRFREYRNGTLVSSSTTPAVLGTAWQQLQVSYTVATAGSSLDFNAYVSSPPAGTCFYADDAVINAP
jgi:nitrous oxidase accessory protein NosD